MAVDSTSDTAPSAFPLRFMVDIVAMTIFGLLPFAFAGAVGPMIQADLALGDALFGRAAGAFFAVSGLASILAGRYVQRVGWQRGLMTTLVLSVIACLGMGLFALSWVTIAIWIGMAGLANSVSQPSSNLALASVIRPGRQGITFGIKQAAVPGAVALAGAAVPLVAIRWGWQSSFILAGALISVYGIRIAGYVRQSRPLGSIRKKRPSDTGPAPTAVLIVLAVGAALGSAPANALSAFLVISLVGRGIEPVTAALILTGASIAGVISRIVVGWAADQRSRGRLAGVAALMGVGSAGYYLLSLEPSALTIIFGSILAFAAGWSWNGLFAYVVVLIAPQAPASATGLTNTGIFLGGFFGPFTFGLLAETSSYAVAWQASAGMSLAGALALISARVWILRRAP